MIHWELFLPTREEPCGWLDEICRFRARVLYDNGRRPAFRKANGYADDDRIDRAAYHLSAQVSGVLAGCVRLFPVPSDDTCFIEELIGVPRFAAMLRGLGVTRRETVEGGRWVVDSIHRGSRLGVLLAAGGLAVARAFGYRVLCCPVGNGMKQDRVLARPGLAAVPNLPLIAVPHLDDRLRVMHVFLAHPGAHLAELMDQMAGKLKLADVPGAPRLPKPAGHHANAHDRLNPLPLPPP